jgi:hypothetical protein
VKELLNRIDAKLETIDNKLDKKVDVRDFELLGSRVEATVRRVDALDQKWEQKIAVERSRMEEHTTTFSRREKILGVLIAAIAVLIQPIQSLLHIGGPH